MRVEKIHSPLLYSISKFDGTGSERDNGTLFYRYSTSLEDTKVPTEVLELANHTTANFETVHSFVDISKDSNQSIKVPVCWDGLSDERYWTWHKITDMFKDVPDMFTTNLEKIKNGPKKKLVTLVQRLPNLS